MTETVGTEDFPSLVTPTSLDEEMKGHRERVARGLPDIDLMRGEDVAVLLVTYQMIIEPNFIRWMQETWRRCRSEVAIEACRENLVCEINENHPKMLRDFVALARRNESAMKRAEAVARRIYRRGQRHKPFGDFDEIVEGENALGGLLIMACLENASIPFIPLLVKAGQRLGVSDFTYTDKHGVADIRHANQFVEAVEAEVALLEIEDPHRIYPSYTQLVEHFLHQIFHAHEAA